MGTLGPPIGSNRNPAMGLLSWCQLELEVITDVTASKMKIQMLHRGVELSWQGSCLGKSAKDTQCDF